MSSAGIEPASIACRAIILTTILRGLTVLEPSKGIKMNILMNEYTESNTPKIIKFFLKLEQLNDFQSLIFSSDINTKLVISKFNELKNSFSPENIDYQIILSFSLNYERISILSTFLSKLDIKKDELIHTDQELLFHLLKNNIS